MHKLADFTRSQIDALELIPNRPLLICDADEVIVHFAAPLETYLKRLGFYINFENYRLEGNIRRQNDDSAVVLDELIPMINDFFAAEVDNLPPVTGAIATLTALAGRAQVVVLTNLPDPFRTRRIASFTRHGLTAPVVTNTGLKGASVRMLADRVQAPVIFIDDTEPHLRSVATTVPDSYRVHFIADQRLAAIQTASPHSHHRSDCWTATGDAVNDFLHSHGF